MDFLADGLAIIGALCAALYCAVLSYRLKGLSRLDKGVGGAVASLVKQVDELKSTLDSAKSEGADSAHRVTLQTARAEQVAGRLEMLLATLHNSETGQEKPVQFKRKPVVQSPPKRPNVSQKMDDIYKVMG